MSNHLHPLLGVVKIKRLHLLSSLSSVLLHLKELYIFITAFYNIFTSSRDRIITHAI